MNGAETLVWTLVTSGVEVCFANPGTSEMHFVAALDRIQGMRPILGLFEGVVIGAADGYGRMAEKPACTLLHLGPGFTNALANLHNARRAATPMVNIVGGGFSVPFAALRQTAGLALKAGPERIKRPLEAETQPFNARLPSKTRHARLWNGRIPSGSPFKTAWFPLALAVASPESGGPWGAKLAPVHRSISPLQSFAVYSFCECEVPLRND